jgi:hypothetical protein
MNNSLVVKIRRFQSARPPASRRFLAIFAGTKCQILSTEAVESALMFLPTLLPAGIEPANLMIQFRNKTYPVSYERRHQSQPVKASAIE